MPPPSSSFDPPPRAKKGIFSSRGLTKPTIPRRSGGPSSSSSGLAVASGSGSGSGSRSGTAARGGDEGYLYLAGVRDGSRRVGEFSSEQDVCPICHTDRQFNPSLRLLVSPCYHRMCESCIDRLFTLGPEPCPTCGRILRKGNFQHQTFEDLRVEREISVRRRMGETFNKRESDFTSMREYDDYLENVENWTFNLLNEIDVESTEKAILSYTRSNTSSIAANKERSTLEALSQAERDDIERKSRAERIRMIEEAERIERTEEERVKVEVVDALARGLTGKAEDIRERHELAKVGRAASLVKALPGGAGMNGNGTGEVEGREVNTTDPTKMDYVGPYVAIPYNPPEELEYQKWMEVKEEYVDGRSWTVWVREDKEGKVRGGGWDLKGFWKGEVEAAVMSLGLEPLR